MKLLASLIILKVLFTVFPPLGWIAWMIIIKRCRGGFTAYSEHASGVV